MGFVVYGHDDSPVVPLMLFMPTKIAGIVTCCLEYNLAAVGVGFPATKMTQERARFCISAGHTKEMLDEVFRCHPKPAILYFVFSSIPNQSYCHK